MNTSGKNKLIAEFMEFQDTPIGWYDAEEYLNENDNTFNTLRFDTDWNWLMPVIKKANGIIRWQPLAVNFPVIGKRLQEAILNNQIKSAYECMVEFIEWYNQNK